MNKKEINMRNNLIDPVEISCEYAIFSKISYDPLFQTMINRFHKPIFCAGYIKSFNQNVAQVQDFLGSPATNPPL